MRDAAAVRRWFTSLAVLEPLQGLDRDLIAEHATWVTLGAGARLHGEGESNSALWFLVEGEIVLGGKPGHAVDGVVRLAITTPGYPVGWDGMVWPGRHRWDAVATSRTLLLRVAREVIDARCRADEGFAARLHRLLLWLAVTQLRSQHTRLITSRYDDETDAVVALIASRADELRATSPLHRISGYLRSRPTVADAFRALEAIRDGREPVEAEIAREALDMLAGVRRELRVYLGLQRVYEAIASAPSESAPRRSEPGRVGRSSTCSARPSTASRGSTVCHRRRAASCCATTCTITPATVCRTVSA